MSNLANTGSSPNIPGGGCVGMTSSAVQALLDAGGSLQNALGGAAMAGALFGMDANPAFTGNFYRTPNAHSGIGNSGTSGGQNHPCMTNGETNDSAFTQTAPPLPKLLGLPPSLLTPTVVPTGPPNPAQGESCSL